MLSEEGAAGQALLVRREGAAFRRAGFLSVYAEKPAGFDDVRRCVCLARFFRNRVRLSLPIDRARCARRSAVTFKVIGFEMQGARR
jgi:hypothetical protein